MNSDGFDNSIPDPFNWLECVKLAHVNLIPLVDKISHYLFQPYYLIFLQVVHTPTIR